MKYRICLCDADNTLFDFHLSEKTAVVKVLSHFGLPHDAETVSLYSRINASLWKALERGEITQQALRTERFRQLTAALGADADCRKIADLFAAELAECAYLMPGAEAFCVRVSAHMPIYLVTNGISTTQRRRFSLSVIKKYIKDIIISEEIGASKPDPAMLSLALSRESLPASDAVLLGDSITADIAAASALQMDSIFIRWGQAITSQNATYHADTLQEAADYITGEQ